jgi:DsbC/DsbD-like thiol-disulfide interchange protein
MKRTFLLLAIIGSLGMATMAQGSAGVVKISASPLKVKKGAAGAGLVTLNINGGYHINSNRPTEAYLIATALKIQPQAGFTIGGVVYPKAKLQKFSFSEKPLSVYEGSVALKFTVRASPSAASQTLKGKLTIQACNDQQCLRPQTVDVNIAVEVN